MERSSDVAAREQLIADFKTVVADAEALLRATANEGGEKLAEVRAKAEESLRVAKDRMAETRAALLARAGAAARASDEFVRENPWKVAAAAAGAGLVTGILLAATCSCSAGSRRCGCHRHVAGGV